MLLLMVPALVVGPAFAGGSLLMHAHGSDGLHGHVLPAGITADVHGHADPALAHSDALHAWHANEHAGHALDPHAAHVDEHGHDLLHDSLHGHVPLGSLSQLPSAIWPHPASSRTAVTLARMLSFESPGAHLPPTLGIHGPATGPPPLALGRFRDAPAVHGSGASRVLSLSHALLI